MRKLLLIPLFFILLLICGCSKEFINSPNEIKITSNNVRSGFEHTLESNISQDFFEEEGGPSTGISHIYEIPNLVIDTVFGSEFTTIVYSFNTLDSLTTIADVKHVGFGTTEYDFVINIDPMDDPLRAAMFEIKIYDSTHNVFIDEFDTQFLFTPFEGQAIPFDGDNHIPYSSRIKIFYTFRYQHVEK